MRPANCIAPAIGPSIYPVTYLEPLRGQSDRHWALISHRSQIRRAAIVHAIASSA